MSSMTPIGIAIGPVPAVVQSVRIGRVARRPRATPTSSRHGDRVVPSPGRNTGLRYHCFSGVKWNEKLEPNTLEARGTTRCEAAAFHSSRDSRPAYGQLVCALHPRILFDIHKDVNLYNLKVTSSFVLERVFICIIYYNNNDNNNNNSNSSYTIQINTNHISSYFYIFLTFTA